MEKKYEGTFYEYQKKKIDDFVEDIVDEWVEVFKNLYGRKPSFEDLDNGLWKSIKSSWFTKCDKIHPAITHMVPPQDYEWDTKSFEREGQQPIAGVLPKKKVPEVEKTREYFGLQTGDTFAEEAEKQLENI